MSSNDITSLLFQIALKSPQSLKYACIITYRNKVISCGFNRYCRKYSLVDGTLDKPCIL